VDPIADELPSSLQPPALAGLDRARLRQSVYRRVFGDADPVKIGRYTVLERIGAGGMGVVFKAYDTQLDRKVAVKVIHFEGATETGRRALVKEARALARLSHPNVVHVYEVGESRDGELFLAMEFVEGVTLRTWLAREGRRWPDVLDVCLQAGEGIAAAHAAGLVHRDFKPDNVMVGTDGRVRVLDFGLARRGTIDAASVELALHATATTTTTVGRDVAGTPAYMAPEQMTGGTLGPAVDQFALCATIYEALYGVRPFQGATMAELHEHASAARLTVPDARCGVPPAVHRVIVQGLAADPERRHASVQVLVGELRRARRHKSMRSALPLAAMSAALTGLGLLMLGGTGALTTPVELGVTEHEDDTQDEVILLRAESQIDEDPTAAVATLAELPEGSPAWNARAFVVAEQADLWGIADRELQLPEGLDIQAIAGTRLVSWRASTAAIEVTDLVTGATQVAVADVDRPPRPQRFTASEDTRPRMHVSPGGRWLVLARADSATNVDLETCEASVLPELDARELQFSPDGTLAAVREGDAVGVYRLDSGTRIASAPIPVGQSRGIAIAIDGANRRLAVARSDGGTIVHEIEDGTTRALDETGAQHLAFAGPHTLLSARLVGGLVAWNLADGTSRSVGPSDERYHRLETLGDGRWLLAQADAGTLVLFDLPADRRSVLGEGELLGASPDRRRVAWVDEAGRANVLDVHSRTVRSLSSGAATAMLGFAPDSRSLVTYAVDRSARSWPLPEDPPALEGHTENVGAVIFSRDGEHVFTAGRDHTLRRWNVGTGDADASVAVEGEIVELDTSADGRLLASRTAGGTIEVWETADAARLARSEAGLTGMAFGGDTLYLTDDAAAWRWDVGTGERTKVLPDVGRCHGIAVSPDGARLAGACGDDVFEGGLRVWDLERGALILEDRRTWFFTMFVSPRELVGGPFDEPTRVLEVDTGTEAVFAPTPAGWRSLSATTDGDTLAIGQAPDGVRLWTRTAKKGASVPGTRGESVGLVTISPDGARIAYSLDRRVISIRERTVPRDPDALRAWVLAHRVVQLETP
jgi:WD40 repeat protein/predicted Ser/Thr protein kinase